MKGESTRAQARPSRKAPACSTEGGSTSFLQRRGCVLLTEGRLCDRGGARRVPAFGGAPVAGPLVPPELRGGAPAVPRVQEEAARLPRRGGRLEMPRSRVVEQSSSGLWRNPAARIAPHSSLRRMAMPSRSEHSPPVCWWIERSPLCRIVRRPALRPALAGAGRLARGTRVTSSGATCRSASPRPRLPERFIRSRALSSTTFPCPACIRRAGPGTFAFHAQSVICGDSVPRRMSRILCQVAAYLAPGICRSREKFACSLFLCGRLRDLKRHETVLAKSGRRRIT